MSVSLLLFDFSYRNFLQGGILNSCFVSMTMTPQVLEQSLFLSFAGAGDLMSIEKMVNGLDGGGVRKHAAAVVE